MSLLDRLAFSIPAFSVTPVLTRTNRVLEVARIFTKHSKCCDIRSAAAARRSVTIGGGDVSRMSAAAARRRRRTALISDHNTEKTPILWPHMSDEGRTNVKSHSVWCDGGHNTERNTMSRMDG